jgi:hypothetical protein
LNEPAPELPAPVSHCRVVFDHDPIALFSWIELTLRLGGGKIFERWLPPARIGTGIDFGDSASI